MKKLIVLICLILLLGANKAPKGFQQSVGKHNYLVVVKYNMSDLVYTVNLLIKKGYKPIGGIHGNGYNSHGHMQAMYRNE